MNPTQKIIEDGVREIFARGRESGEPLSEILRKALGYGTHYGPALVLQVVMEVSEGYTLAGAGSINLQQTNQPFTVQQTAAAPSRFDVQKTYGMAASGFTVGGFVQPPPLTLKVAPSISTNNPPFTVQQTMAAPQFTTSRTLGLPPPTFKK